jgi:hypothetical protein
MTDDLRGDMAINKERMIRYLVASAIGLALVFCLVLTELSGQVRSGRRGTVVRGEEGRGAAVGRRGAVVKGDEGYAAVGRRGAAVKGEEGAAAVGRHGAVVAGEEGFAARGRYGSVVVGDRYEDYEAWRAVAGVGAAIAIGTMLARPPTGATTVVIGGTTYWVHQNTYYMRVYSGGSVAYQVVAPPR